MRPHPTAVFVGHPLLPRSFGKRRQERSVPRCGGCALAAVDRVRLPLLGYNPRRRRRLTRTNLVLAHGTVPLHSCTQHSIVKTHPRGGCASIVWRRKHRTAKGGLVPRRAGAARAGVDCARRQLYQTPRAAAATPRSPNKTCLCVCCRTHGSSMSCLSSSPRWYLASALAPRAPPWRNAGRHGGFAPCATACGASYRVPTPADRHVSHPPRCRTWFGSHRCSPERILPRRLALASIARVRGARVDDTSRRMDLT